MNKLLKALVMLLVVVPASVFIAALLWNAILVQAVSWANPISFWQMFGLMILFYIIWPGSKHSMIKKDKDDK
tara:strand:- start:469 stop:684 length:216 start_codon:yes stop_codon:yes gene_type:complete